MNKLEDIILKSIYGKKLTDREKLTIIGAYCEDVIELLETLKSEWKYTKGQHTYMDEIKILLRRINEIIAE